MGIFSKIFGQGTKEETANEIEQLLVDMEREVDAAKRTISEIDTRRGALLVAGDDAGLDADQIARERATRTIERAELGRPDINRRLAEARERARQITIAQLRQERQALAEELFAAFEHAITVNERAQAHFDKCQALIGRDPSTGLGDTIAFPLLRREMMVPWRAYVEQQQGPVRRIATPPARLPTPAAVAKPARPMQPSKPDTEPSPRRKPDTAEAAEGFIRLVLIRPGLELDDGGRSQVGDVVDFEYERGMALMRNGAADLAASENVVAEREAAQPAKEKRSRKSTTEGTEE